MLKHFVRQTCQSTSAYLKCQARPVWNKDVHTMLRCIRRNPEVTNTQRSPLRACRSYGPLVRTVQLIMPHSRATPCMHDTPQLDRLIAIEIRSRIITITRIPPKTRITNECTHTLHTLHASHQRTHQQQALILPLNFCGLACALTGTDASTANTARSYSTHTHATH